MSGWIKLHRKIKRWEWYDHIPTRLVFIHLLLSVNYEKKTWKGIEILPGQDVFSVASLSKETGFTVRQIRTVLNNLLKSRDISIETSRNFSIVTLLKWDEYQENSDTQTTNQTTNDRQTERQTNDKLQPYVHNVYRETATNDRHTKRQTIGTLNDKQTTTPKEIKKKELKKKEFLNNLNLNASLHEILKTDKSFLDVFMKYWTCVGENGNMRFESLPFFDFDKQVQLFQKNRIKFLKATPKSPQNGKAKQSTLDNIIINRNWEQ